MNGPSHCPGHRRPTRFPSGRAQEGEQSLSNAYPHKLSKSAGEMPANGQIPDNPMGCAEPQVCRCRMAFPRAAGGSGRRLRTSEEGGAEMIWKDFTEFVNKGSAVGVVIGAAFGKIVDSLVNDIIMPVIGFVTGGVDFSARFLVLTGGSSAFKTVAEARQAGLPVLAYGLFINTIVQFFLIAFSIF